MLYCTTSHAFSSSINLTTPAWLLFRWRPFISSGLQRRHRHARSLRSVLLKTAKPNSQVKSSQVNTLPKAKSQAKDKRAKDRQQYAALRCKVGVAPPGFEVRRRMSRVAFRVFPAGRAGDTRAAICAISCFVSRFRVCVYVVLVYIFI